MSPTLSDVCEGQLIDRDERLLVNPISIINNAVIEIIT